MTHKPYETHPSYAMVRFARVQGSTRRLFGSRLKNHHSFIRLIVSPGHYKHDLGRDWYASDSKQLITIDMSAAQFATLITSMNHGDGVPATFRFRIDLGNVEPPPGDDTEFDRAVEYGTDQIKGIGALAAKAQKLCGDIFKSKRRKPTMAQGQEAFEMLHKLSQFLTSNYDFYIEQLKDAAEKSISHAHAEIDAAVTMMLQRLGVQKLEELKALSDAVYEASKTDQDMIEGTEQAYRELEAGLGVKGPLPEDDDQ